MRGERAVHPASRPDDARDPRHLLHAAGTGSALDTDAAIEHAARPTPASRSSSCSDRSPSTKAALGSECRRI